MKERPIRITELIEKTGFIDRRPAGYHYEYLCELLVKYPPGENERIDISFNGPIVDPNTGDIEYEVTECVDRIFTLKILEELDR